MSATDFKNQPRWYMAGDMSDDQFSALTDEAEHEYLKQIVLGDANAIRHALAIGEGLLPELPKGKIGDNRLCVLARALSNGWEPDVDPTCTTLKHDWDTMSYSQIRLAADQLSEFGFKGVHLAPDKDPGELTFDEIDEEYPEHCWILSFDNTYAMELLIDLFDNKKIPELILDKS